MSLFDGLLEEDATPLSAPAPRIMPPDARPYLVTLKQASNGADILLCTVTPPSATAIAEAKQRNLALFTLDEIPAMRQAANDDPRYIDTLIAARRLMGWGGLITHKEAE